MSENRLLGEFERLGGEFSRLFDDDPSAGIKTGRELFCRQEFAFIASQLEPIASGEEAA
jgi:hypothetical protein